MRLWTRRACRLNDSDSLISIQRSLPSLVRSPTPANTETLRAAGYVVDQLHDDYGLAYAGATEEADFPPFKNGWMRSITFTPVSNIRPWSIVHRTRGEAVNRHSLLKAIGPRSSTGSPMTFITRPSVPRPTGTEMGPPWSMASYAHHAFGGFHGDAAHAAFAEMLLHLKNDADGGRHGEASLTTSALDRWEAWPIR